jgi:hypothetical protein
MPVVRPVFISGRNPQRPLVRRLSTGLTGRSGVASVTHPR